MTPAVEFHGLRKRFRRLQVLDGIDAALSSGRTTAIVGPNASGKSTLIKCVLGLVRPDVGECLVLGQPAGSDPEYRRRIGYMPQGAPLPENLTGREILSLVRSLRPSDPVDEDLLHRYNLGAELDKPVRTLSGGTRQKLNVIVAFLFRPKLIVLDEPTAGLDPLASAILKDRVQESVQAGASVLLTSHVMSEVEELADEVLFLVDGKAHFHGSLEGLRSLTGEHRLERAVARLMRMRAA